MFTFGILYAIIYLSKEREVVTMSNVKSFRLNEYEENLLYQCTLNGCSTHTALVNALEYYFENVINKTQGFDMVLNFDQMPAGVNNPMVKDFMEQIVQKTDYKFGMYLDADNIGFKKQEVLQ